MKEFRTKDYGYQYKIDGTTTVCIFKNSYGVFSGVARLSEGDKYDENKGKAIAKLKALIKYNKEKLYQHSAVCIHNIDLTINKDEILKYIYERILMYKDNYDHIANKIEELAAELETLSNE